jgi:hypothetical protein
MPDESAAALIDAKIIALPDWRGATLARLRALVQQALPDAVEEWKWNTPVWSAGGGIVCTGEVYKQVVKLTFPKGAALPDPAELFNSSLEGKVRRAIDFGEGAKPNTKALKALFQAAAAANGGPPANTAPKKTAKPKTPEPKLLVGGNPQVAKADGNAPVQAFIAAIPGWKQAMAQQVDALVDRAVPEVCKAVKWNSPFYGVPGQGWFLSFHCHTRYLKLAFFKGAALKPLPPEASKQPEVRYLHLHEHDTIDEALLLGWLRQASALPGWNPSKTSP